MVQIVFDLQFLCLQMLFQGTQEKILITKNRTEFSAL